MLLRDARALECEKPIRSAPDHGFTRRNGVPITVEFQKGHVRPLRIFPRLGPQT